MGRAVSNCSYYCIFSNLFLIQQSLFHFITTICWGLAPAGSRGTLRGDRISERDLERERNNVADKKIEERKRLIFLGLCRKPIKPQHGTCSVHVDHRRLHAEHLIERVLEPRAGKWTQRASALQGIGLKNKGRERKKEWHGVTKLWWARPITVFSKGAFIP